MKNAKKIILGTSLFLALGASSASAETLWANGVSESGGWSDFNKTRSDNNDNDLCWAAAASNIINWWQKQYKIPEYVPEEDEIWNSFKRSFTDDGSNPHQAFYWWFDGSYSPPSTNAAKLKADADRAAYYYPYGDSCISAYMGQYDKMCDFIINSLTNGCGITLGLSFAHEVTLWGIEYDSSSNDITKLWLTDSDDLQNEKNPGGIFSVDCYKYVYPYGEAYLGIKGYWGKSADDLVYAQMATALKPATFLEAIPEPSAFGLLAGLGALAVVASRRRRK